PNADAKGAEQLITQPGAPVTPPTASDLSTHPVFGGALVGGAPMKGAVFAVFVKAGEADKRA
ncbi:triose-phosphate isomerase, partial [Enterobacter bugandensis]|uniref:hypothetical protein n=1 Tax=Enterobacter bugandensis TaxID=881260 RepID=UPI003BF9C4C7|nr:triose-phosphate isomerase [Enterobacter bugandensis]